MAFSEQHQLQAIHRIAESLNSCERRRLFYLCGSSEVTDDSVACVKEILKSTVMRHDRGHQHLTELLVELRRFDILRDVCQTSREDVERTVTPHRPFLPRFRVLMANISEDLASEDLHSVKFLLSSTLPRDKLEKARNFLDVIIELEKLDKVSPKRVDFVEECLMNVGRVDLAKKVNAYKITVVRSAQHLSPQQRSSVPGSFPAANLYPSLQKTRKGQSLYSGSENIPVSVNREQNRQSQLDCYKFNTNPRGLCIIIDCVGNDGDMLEETFKALHFKVVLYKWLSVDDTLWALRGMLRLRENLEGDSFVCCLISRGTENDLLGTDLFGPSLPLDNVRRLFTSEACPALAGKPKLFFIQRYSVHDSQPFTGTQHHRDEDLETDGCDDMSRRHVIPTDADVSWSHCWTDERQLEQGHHRSVYLKALTEALHRGQRMKTRLVDVHIEVNGAIFEYNKRNPGLSYHIDLKHTLRKYLHLQ